MTSTPNSSPAAGLQIAVVPDSFKGSARASEVAEAISTGFLAGAGSLGREISVTAVPFADGGEGTLEALIDAWGTEAVPVQTTDALSRPVQSRLGLSADGKIAVVEAAGNPETNVTGTLTINSTGGANLPATYTFDAADQGVPR